MKILVTNFKDCFLSNSTLTGNAPELWNTLPSADGIGCFTDCTGLDNYDDIPADRK